LRLEKETARSFKRSIAPGADFEDDFGRTWDAIGSDVDDRIFNYDRFVARLKRKLDVAAADRYVLDLTLLREHNASQVLTYFWTLPTEQQARATVLRW
jgi:hypothetical protein